MREYKERKRKEASPTVAAAFRTPGAPLQYSAKTTDHNAAPPSMEKENVMPGPTSTTTATSSETAKWNDVGAEPEFFDKGEDETNSDEECEARKEL